MKKRVAQVVTGILFASMLALAGCGSTQTTGAETSDAEVVEEVEVSVEDNEASSLTDSENYKEVTKYKTLEEFESSLGSDKMVAYVYTKGYNGITLLVSEKSNVITRSNFDKDPAKNYCSDAKFYTVVDGYVRCIGRLNPTGSAGDISITDNGVIFATENHDGIESYLISKDGRDIVHKDYYLWDSGWGYYNESNDLSQRVEFTKDQQYIDKIEALRAKAKIVEFRAPRG